MSAWINVVNVNALAEGEHLTFVLNGTEVVVFNVEGAFYAIEDVCTHDGMTIAEGTVKDCSIICPRHGARFCLKTGAVLSPPAYEAVQCFPLRVEQGVLQIKEND
jgi:3-phenylpropionate/trans-cinnamate dioxygenase ferredoxin subunit